MRRYIENLHEREPHERRAHAMRAAVVITAALFFVWITTLGVRLANNTPVAGSESTAGLANVISGATYTPNTLEVAPTNY